MRKDKIENYVKGWVVGDFEPSILRHKDLEVGIAYHKKNEPTQQHYHTSSEEYNFIINGRMRVNEKILEKGDIFIYERMDISNCEFIEDTTLMIIRIPSAPNDKVIV